MNHCSIGIVIINKIKKNCVAPPDGVGQGGNGNECVHIAIPCALRANIRKKLKEEQNNQKNGTTMMKNRKEYV